MTGAGQYLTLAMTMIFAENLLFSRGMGGDVTLRVSVRPAEYMKFGALITVFTVLSSLVGWIADSLIARMSIVVSTSVFPGRTLAYLLCMIGLYLLADQLLPRAAPRFYRSVRSALPLSVFNTAVLGAPLLLSRLRPTLFAGLDSGFLGALIFGLSIGIGFLFAMLLMAEGLRQIESMDLPESFYGLPAKFIYVGLLAMAFSAITGRQSGI